MNEGKTLAYSKAMSFLTFITKRSILDVAAALDPPLSSTELILTNNPCSFQNAFVIKTGLLSFH